MIDRFEIRVKRKNNGEFQKSQFEYADTKTLIAYLQNPNIQVISVISYELAAVQRPCILALALEGDSETTKVQLTAWRNEPAPMAKCGECGWVGDWSDTGNASACPNCSDDTQLSDYEGEEE